MNSLFSLLFRSLILIVTIAVIAMGVVGYLLFASIPDYNESFRLPGISAPVDILRDANAVPHIRGRSDQDIFFAMGFVHAQDRLGQMLRVREAAEGIGELRESAVPGVGVSDDLVAYANGVNAWITEIAQGGRGRGTPELLLLDAAVKPWQPVDSLKIARLFLSDTQPRNSESAWRATSETPIPDDRPEISELFWQPPRSSFRAWGVPADRTTSEAPIITANMTGPLSLPAQWYLADLGLKNGPVIGATLPGLPYVVVGRSVDVAWAFATPRSPGSSMSSADTEQSLHAFLTALKALSGSSSAKEAVESLDQFLPDDMQLVVADRRSLEEWPRSVSRSETGASPPDFLALRQYALDERQAVFSRDSAIAVQQDTVSAAARVLLPLLARELWFDSGGVANDIGEAASLRENVLGRLARWNGDMERLAPEPLIFWAWIRAVQARILEDEFPTAAPLWNRPNPLFLLAVLTNRDGGAAWCDIRPTEKVETCQELVRWALDDAIRWVAGRYGNDLSQWYWGAEHAAVMTWSAVGAEGLIGDLINIRAMISGDPETLRSSSFSADVAMPFESRSGTNFQAVMLLGEDEMSYFITPSGQSGHPLSRFYDNFLTRWTQGQYLSMTTEISVARAGAVGNARLLPWSSDQE